MIKFLIFTILAVSVAIAACDAKPPKPKTDFPTAERSKS
jgi:hypothetical protein